MKQPDMSKFARIDHGRVVIRYSVSDKWHVIGWGPKRARKFAKYVKKLAKSIER